MKKTILSYTILGIIACIIITNIILLLCGFRMFYVRTASMEPEIHVGALVYSKKLTDEDLLKQLKIGDDITYQTSTGAIVTHRIVEIDQINQTFATEGINSDNPITERGITTKQILGVAKFNIPILGYIPMFFKDILPSLLHNKFFVIALVMLILLIIILTLLFKELKKGKKKENN